METYSTPQNYDAGSTFAPDGRAGPSDLYYVTRMGECWGEPKSMASDVNLHESTENFVIFGPTGEDLYFVRDFSLYYRVSLNDALQLD